MKKQKSIERRVTDLEESRGTHVPVVTRVDADDPHKDAKIAAAKEVCGDKESIIILQRFV